MQAYGSGDYFLVCVKSRNKVIIRDLQDAEAAKDELLRHADELERHFDVLEFVVSDNPHDGNVQYFTDEGIIEVQSDIDHHPDFRVLRDLLPQILGPCKVDYEFKNPGELKRLDKYLNRHNVKHHPITLRTMNNRISIEGEHRVVKVVDNHQSFQKKFRDKYSYGVFPVWMQFGDIFFDFHRDSGKFRQPSRNRERLRRDENSKPPRHDRRRLEEEEIISRRSQPQAAPSHRSNSHRSSDSERERRQVKPPRGRGRGRGRGKGPRTRGTRGKRGRRGRGLRPI